MWRVYPSFLQLTFPPLLTALAIQKAQKHVTTQTNDGNPPSPQRHTEGEGTHLVEQVLGVVVEGVVGEHALVSVDTVPRGVEQLAREVT
jgi:hypothetical protein